MVANGAPQVSTYVCLETEASTTKSVFNDGRSEDGFVVDGLPC
jgi:hypothetical protein